MIVLPWQNKTLSPNARAHWRTLSSAKKRAKTSAYYLTRQAIGAARYTAPVTVVVTFCPPDRRPRDLDNMIASFKAAQDGIAQAIGVDDSLWRVSYQRGPVKRGGEVIVQLDGVADVPFRGVIS